ncbi:MAG TPA: single-stranded-DNA-specific exonuclease RecJ [Rhizomicrobium sp.]|nr:single-stranded-DNA-specific exonuclease RecJ [Rhizomicrobium sp.]
MSEALAAAPFGVARSFSGRRWRLDAGDENLARRLQQEAMLSPVLARLLAARGVSVEEASDYLHPTLKKFLPDPSALAEMDMAVARVKKALEVGERIAVFGDYDVDGSASASLLSGFFTAAGSPPRVYIPDRMREGYGPSSAAIEALCREGASLVVTVDCGASGGAAFETARALGLDVVVLDHHRVEARPNAHAHVNPNQPADQTGLTYLCAAGLTFLFMVGLNRALRESGFYAARGIAEPDLRDYLDLVGLATVCDVVPLCGVNRAFVRQGLVLLAKLSRPGLAALASVARASPPFTTYHLGFVFGPRINAGGRVGRSSLGTDLLSAGDQVIAAEFAAQLDLHNRERQEIERLILDEAVAQAGAQDNAPFLLVTNDGWHPGVVGIVAGRLKERFVKPAFVAGFEGVMGRGSARSIPGIDVGRIVRTAHECGVIETGGGHAMAAGFSLTEDQLSPFRQFLHAQFTGAEAPYEAAATLVMDAIASPASAGRGLVSEIALAGPYGAGNPEPVLAFPDLRIAFADVVGATHIKVRLTGGDGTPLDAIAFRAVGTPLGEGLLKSRGRFVHAAGRLKADNWNGDSRVQLQIEDAAPAGA